MKFKILLLFTVIFFNVSFSQKGIITIALPDTISSWDKKNIVGFDMSEIAFLNWSPGGVSSISGLLKGDFIRNYKKENTVFYNEMTIRYGINKQDGFQIRKTDDVFKITSTLGFRRDSISKWYHSAKFSFNTQFSDGYNYPNKEIAISKPFSPAYTFLGIGAEYTDKANFFFLYLSPLTLKNTLVFDQNLANQGAFGVKKAIYDTSGNIIFKGENTKTELGILISSSYKKQVFKNINLDSKLILYSDYINKFGNIDVDLQSGLDLIVNQYVKANIGFNLVYDDDIKTKKEIDNQQVPAGPKIQLKQMLGVGLQYVF